MTKEISLIDQIKSSKRLQILFNNDNQSYNKYMINVLNEISQNKGLQECTLESILECVSDAKNYNLPIDSRQFCHLIAYKDKTDNFAKKCKMQIGYRGFLYKMQEVLKDFDYKVGYVYEGEDFTVSSKNDNDFYDHKIKNPFADPKNAIGIYLYFTYTLNGEKCSKIEIAAKEDIDNAKNAAIRQEVWDKWFGEMGKKFIIKRACKGRFNNDPIISQLIEYDNKDYKMENVTPAPAPDPALMSYESEEEKAAKVKTEEEALVKMCASEASKITTIENLDKLDSKYKKHIEMKNNLSDETKLSIAHEIFKKRSELEYNTSNKESV